MAYVICQNTIFHKRIVVCERKKSRARPSIDVVDIGGVFDTV